MELSYTLETINDAVKQFWQAAQPHPDPLQRRGRGCRTFAFSGEMGAGKTTFVHRLCDYLQVEDVVSSPTFALINEYHFRDANGQDKTIYHLDWYRLKNAEEAVAAGMEDCIDQAARGEAICFIEWPEKAKDLLRTPYFWIHIETTGPEERTLVAKLVE